MLYTPSHYNAPGITISSVRMSLGRTGGCFGGMCKLPPLSSDLFDKVFRADELHARALNLPTPVYSPAIQTEDDQSGAP